MDAHIHEIPRWELSSHHSGDIYRLRKLLNTEGSFQLVLLEFNDPAYRDRVIRHIKGLCGESGILKVDEQSHPTYESFEPELLAAFETHKAIHILNLENWFTPPEGHSRIRGFNHHRETIAEACLGMMMLWLTEEGIRNIALEAPDLWAWRSAVLDFTIQKEPIDAMARRFVDRRIDLGSANYPSRLKRIQEINDYLADKREDLPERQLGLLLLEKGRLLERMSRIEEALAVLWESYEIQKQLHNRRDAAVTLGYIARIKGNQGLVEEALNMDMERMKVFEELGDKWSLAGTFGDIANLKRSQGIFEKAHDLNLDQLKLYEELGDVTGKAMTLYNLGLIELKCKNIKSAIRYLTESNELFTKIQKLDGMCLSGLVMGELLCTSGKKDEGLAILRRSLRGFRQMKWEIQAKQAEDFIAKFESEHPDSNGQSSS